MIERVLVAGGGTGGHLFPGVAVVEELRRRGPVAVRWVGTRRGIEARVLPERGEALELLEVTPLKGRGSGDVARSVARIPRSVAASTRMVRAFRPDLVVGLGGYAAGPVLVAASSLGVPTAILEQNARVGLTNRLLAGVAGRAYVSFEETAGEFPTARVRSVGNPVRRDFVDAARRASADPEGFEARARQVLVVGGSQGAKRLNEVVPEALARGGVAATGLRIVHQTGAAMRDEVAARYRDLGLEAEVVPFLGDMARAYAEAAFVVCRAGATTVAELCAVGRAAVLVPYPHAADDHQRKNAEALARQGAAVAMPEDALDVPTLAAEVRRLAGDRGARLALADGARRLGRPDAAAAIVDDLVTWLGPTPRRQPERRPHALLSAAVAPPPEDAPQRHPGLRGRRPYHPGLVAADGARRGSRPRRQLTAAAAATSRLD